VYVCVSTAARASCSAGSVFSSPAMAHHVLLRCPVQEKSAPAWYISTEAVALDRPPGGSPFSWGWVVTSGGPPGGRSLSKDGTAQIAQWILPLSSRLCNTRAPRGMSVPDWLLSEDKREALFPCLKLGDAADLVSLALSTEKGRPSAGTRRIPPSRKSGFTWVIRNQDLAQEIGKRYGKEIAQLM
jgi:hypothetical protein